MPAAPEQLTAAPLWAQPHAHHAALATPPTMHAHHAALATPPTMRARPLLEGEALDFSARLGAQPTFVIMALP